MVKLRGNLYIKKGGRMRKSFTLMETIMVVVVIGILSTLGIATYRQLLDNARQKVCETNLKTLETAVEMYALENDALPASLGDLKPSQVKKAYAKVMRKEGWFTKFAYFFVKLNTPREVYAQFLTYDNLGKYGAASQVFHCPADTNGGVSYGINAQLAGKRWRDISEDTWIVADCDNYTFSSSGALAYRHIKNLGVRRVALGVKKNKKIGREERRGGGGDGFYNGMVGCGGESQGGRDPGEGRGSHR